MIMRVFIVAISRCGDFRGAESCEREEIVSRSIEINGACIDPGQTAASRLISPQTMYVRVADAQRINYKLFHQSRLSLMKLSRQDLAAQVC